MTTTSIQGAPAAVPVDRRQMTSALIASVFSWALDLFDLFILLYVAPIIGALFFPSHIPTLSLAAVYASFAVTTALRGRADADPFLLIFQAPPSSVRFRSGRW